MIEIIPNWHPVMVHFTVALFSVSAVFYLLTFLMGESELVSNWYVIARWSLWIGMGMTVLTAASGLYAYNTVAHDTPSHTAMTLHRDWALGTITLFSVLTIWSLIKHRGGAKASVLLVVVMLVAGGVMASTAWRGGEAVYRYGLGVMSLPKIDDHGHGSSSMKGDDHQSEGSDIDITANLGEMGHTEDVMVKKDQIEPIEKTSASTITKKNDHYDDGHTH